MVAPGGRPDRQSVEELPDQAVVARVLEGDLGLFELIMRRYNRRLFRIARGILGDEHEAEDAVQDAYVRAYLKLDQFRGPGGFGSWICQIATNEALMRRRSQKGVVLAGTNESGRSANENAAAAEPRSLAVSPEAALHDAQLRRLLEQAIDRLPVSYRAAFVLREVEQMSVAETASCLGVEPATVKTRVHRARRLLQRDLTSELSAVLPNAFPFAGERCDRLVRCVFQRLTPP